MKAPVLNRRLTLEEPVDVADGAGGFTRTWVELGALWANIKAGTGRERAVESMTASTISWKITVRAAPHGSPSRPKPEQRFRAGARLFRIVAVAEADHSARYLTCFAQEEVSV
ncbi:MULTISPECIES: phage head closure protein [Maritimibacter]|jgi:SPP1 family predicted phage head-tail adaptor|uniref:Head-tail adaptor, putative n=1 Tax=Maritimibacter alkaliphilus HTCC2654 TaxID=314271 RepID=A3VL25_9RHOB|nr:MULTISPECIES: phage head closure protein [Maritimibacter]EAQ11075.1 head-tail adaptor, putative [Rhodobacterales bacterium HTCC2654] [Maritimibacter alkaliphilus HTCC2654]MBL6429343.1 phage head closure protein [Maritimibacter sp.]TYP81633.1 SPP1 family predicted phage head-tail adaptor [Maritimibacter alkaliphilus HTCC2654]